MGRRKRRDEAPLNLFSFQDIMACLTGVLIMITLTLLRDGLSDRPTTFAGGSAPSASASALREELAILRRTPSPETGGTDLAQRDVDVLDERVAQLTRDAELTRAALERAQRALRDEEVRVREADARAEEIVRQQADQRRAARAAALRSRIDLRPGARDLEPVIVEVMPDRVRLGVLTADGVPERRADIVDVAGAPDLDALRRALEAFPPSRHSLGFVVHEGAAERFRTLRAAAAGGGTRGAYQHGWGPWADSFSIFDLPAEAGR